MPLLTDIRIRAARSADQPAAIAVLVDAFSDGTVAAWAQPHPIARGAQLRGYFTLLLTHAATHGIIRVAHTTDTGKTINGVAVWYPWPPIGAVDVHNLTPDLPDTADRGGDAGDGAAQGASRLAALEHTLQARHPGAPHQYLAYLAVSPHRQDQGIGTALLADRHRVLDGTGTPAYLEANDPRNRALYARLGYTNHGRPVTVAGSPPVWPMWRHPYPPTAAGPAAAPRQR